MMPQLPEQFLNSMSGVPGFSREDFTAVHRDVPRITSVRLNPFKPVELDFLTAARVPWSANAFYLDDRPSFTHDPLFHAGCYYVQEAGSMFVEYAVRNTVDLTTPLKVLDACAAPGGKSTLLNSLLKETDLLVSNELIRSRAGILTDNLGRWGTANTVVTNNETEKFASLESFFDLAVVDAPCSGSGLFRKQPEAVSEWSAEAVTACSLRQKKILADLLPSLKHNGCLVYCTCSYSEAENEEIVKWLVNEHGMEYQPLKPDKGWNLVETPFGYRFYPHLTRAEGFFCAVLLKRSGQADPTRRIKEKKAISGAESAPLSGFVKSMGQTIVKQGDHFHLVGPEVNRFLAGFEKHFYFKKAGVSLGQVKGRDFIPHQELAWSIYRGDTINILELGREDAIAFLRKENFGIYPQHKGFSLACYKRQGLGWAKLLGNRNNNYLPPELRILK